MRFGSYQGRRLIHNHEIIMLLIAIGILGAVAVRDRRSDTTPAGPTRPSTTTTVTQPPKKDDKQRLIDSSDDSKYVPRKSKRFTTDVE